MFKKKNSKGYKSPVEGIEMKTIVHGEKTLMVEFRLTAGSTLPAHSHPHEQTGYLVAGHIELNIGGKTYDTRPGDSWCIPADMEHGAQIIEDALAVEVFSPVRKDYLP